LSTTYPKFTVLKENIPRLVDPNHVLHRTCESKTFQYHIIDGTIRNTVQIRSVDLHVASSENTEIIATAGFPALNAHIRSQRQHILTIRQFVVKVERSNGIYTRAQCVRTHLRKLARTQQAFAKGNGVHVAVAIDLTECGVPGMAQGPAKQ
jgi:hypothetical protein